MSFESNFVNSNLVPETQAYKVYVDGAKKIWDLYSDRYEITPTSPQKVTAGKNREVNIRINGKRALAISIGLKTTTLYVYDEALLPVIPLNYNLSPQKIHRYTFMNVDDCINAIKGAI